MDELLKNQNTDKNPNIDPLSQGDINLDTTPMGISDSIKNIGIDTDKIKKTLINFVVPIVSLIITLLLVVSFIYPAFSDYSEMKKNILDKEEKVNLLTEKVSKLRKMKDFSTVISEDSELVNKVLVSESDAPRLLDQVNQISRNSGMDISKLNYSYGETLPGDTSKEASKESYSSIDVSLGVDGSYEQLIVLMENIENAARLVSVSSFRFAEINNKESTGIITSNVSLVSPYLFVQSNAVTDDAVNLDISSSSFINFINRIKSMRFYDFLGVPPAPEVVNEEKESEENISEAIPQETQEVQGDTDLNTSEI